MNSRESYFFFFLISNYKAIGENNNNREINVQYAHFFIGVNNPFFQNSSVYLRQEDFNNNCDNSFGETRSP